MTATLIHRSKRDAGALYQGGAIDVIESDNKYDTIILCAMEWQPEASLFAGSRTQVVYAPNDDGPTPNREQIETATKAARTAARAYRNGGRVLISCMQGRNRSGLVTALCLTILCGISGREAQALVRSRRPTSLTNRHFQKFLSKVPSKLKAQGP